MPATLKSHFVVVDAGGLFASTGGSSLNMPFGGVVERSQEYGKSSLSLICRSIPSLTVHPVPSNGRRVLAGVLERFAPHHSGLKNEAVRHRGTGLN